MIVRVSMLERVVLNVGDSDQRRRPPLPPHAYTQTPLRTAGHLIYIPPFVDSATANLARLHASCLQHQPNMCVHVSQPSRPRRILRRLKPLNESSYSHD